MKMPTLNKGSKGKAVQVLQENLKAIGLYPYKVDGDFGPQTRQSVLHFQQRYFVDGIADLHTQNSVNEAMIAWSSAERVILVDVPNGLKEIKASFGHIAWEEAGGGNIIVTNDWSKNNIIVVDLPVVGRHAIHKKLKGVFEAVFHEINSRGLDGKITQFGTWCPRHKMHNPNKGLSTHSWGIACDINWVTNMPGRVGDIDRGIVAVFEKHGFEWGGRWNYRDDMHFQYARGY
jgi:hypothetical protein